MRVVEHYLGPAAPRFVERQVTSHLEKQPSQVTAEDLPHLTEWIKVSLAFITDDTGLIDECTKRLSQLL